ncbi:asparagine synthase-related protein [Chloroflexota bacterium]
MPQVNTLYKSGSIYETVARALVESVRRNLSDGLLLSGGLDTVLLAYIAVKWVKPNCVTVAFRGAPTPDVKYANLVARNLKLNHCVHYFDSDELDEAIRAVITVLKTFDPMEVRNSAAAYIALKVAKDRGIKIVMTGDGGDELFGGYSFLFELTRKQLKAALGKLWSNMRFSSVPMAESLDLQVKLPFLDTEFRAFAEALDVGLMVRRERGQIWGKWVLRKAFENVVPPELLWRVKAPLEVGSGTTVLPSVMDTRISDLEYAKEKDKYLNEDGVTIRSKEHLFYYQIYRDLIGVPYAKDSGRKACPDCGVNVEEENSFCRICGAYPI